MDRNTFSQSDVRTTSSQTMKIAIVSALAIFVVAGVLSSGALQVYAANLTLHVVPAKGNVNRVVKVSGGGFIPSATVTIKLQSKVVATVVVNSTGGFATTFKVPQSTAGVKTLTVSDGTNSISRTFTVVSHITLKPKSGLPGTILTVNGNGFAASSTVKITFNGVQIKSIKSNSTGGYSTTFTVPNDAAAAYPVVATDGSKNTATATFTIT